MLHGVKLSPDEFTSLERKMKDDLQKFESEIKTLKRNKFERHAEDYKKGTVYKWQQPMWKERRPAASRQRERFARNEGNRDNYMTEESDPALSSDSTHSQDERFLDPRPRGGSRHNNQRRGARGKGRGGGRKNINPSSVVTRSKSKP